MTYMFRPANPDDLGALRALWGLCFPGESLYADYFFSRLFRPDQALVAADSNGVPSAMLHMLSYRFFWMGRSVPLSYLYGIGTHPDHRGRGLCQKLISHALADMHRRNVLFAALIPQEDSLFAFYEKVGFSPIFTLPEAYGFDESGTIPAGSEHIPALDAIFAAHMQDRPHVLRDEAVWRGILDECSLTGGQILLHPERGHEPGSYAVFAGRRVIEAFGPAARPLGQHPFGSLRIVDAASAADLSEIPLPVSDPLAPWNNGLWGAKGLLGQTLLTPEEAAVRLFDGGSEPYMNLMHN